MTTQNTHAAPDLAAHAKHTTGAIRIAEILIPEGIDNHGRPSRIKTAWGEKTREGIADLIDNETSAPELLAALALANEQIAELQNVIGATPVSHGVMGSLARKDWANRARAELQRADQTRDIARAALAKAKGGA